MGFAPSAAQADTPTPVSFVTMHSTSGDYVGQGLSQAWYPGNGSVSVSGGPTVASINVSGGTHGKSFSIDVAAPAGQPLAAGTYLDAMRTPFRAAGRPGIDVFGDGRGCNTVSGRFEIDDVLYTEGVGFERLSLTYESHCEESESTATFGQVVWNRADTASALLAVPDHVSFPPADVGSAAGLAAVRLVNRAATPVSINTVTIIGTDSDSFAIKANSCGVSIAASGLCTITLGANPQGAGALAAELQIDTSDGLQVTALTAQGQPGVSRIDMTGDPGDWITGGSDITLEPSGGFSISGTGTAETGVTINAAGTDYWSLRFVAGANDLLAAGRTYAGAARAAFRGSAPGLEVSGDGRGCNTIQGSFTVHEISVNEATSRLLSFAATFEQHCEGGLPAAYGAVNYRALNPVDLEPLAGDPAPPAVSGLDHLAQIGGATIAWTNPAVDDFDSAIVRLSEGTTPPATPFSGELVLQTQGNIAVIYGLVPSRTYSVSVFSRDAAGSFGPAASLTLRGTDLAVAVNRGTVLPGSSATWTARLRDAQSGAALAGQEVAFMVRKAGSRVWSVADIVTTNSGGSATLTLVPIVAVQVQAYYYGGDQRLGSTAGPTLTVIGRRATAAAVDSTLNRGNTLVIKGRVAPATTTAVTLQRYYGGAWRSLSTRSSRSDGVYSLSRVVSTTGKQKYRVWVASKGPFAAGSSSDVWITVK